MQRLDHCVVHINPEPNQLVTLKEQVTALGFPFDPARGKGTKGFKVANLWVGNQYLELPWLKTSDGGGWRQPWVDKYNRGVRGTYGLCIMTDELDALYADLIKRGIAAGAPERITFTALFGLMKKSLPFRKVYTPEIPGTNLQIFFLEMDSEKMYATMQKYMKPNAKENGITGIDEAFVQCNFSNDAWQYIKTLFPTLSGGEPHATYDMGGSKLHFVQSEEPDLRVVLHAVTENDQIQRGSFDIENLRVTTLPLG